MLDDRKIQLIVFAVVILLGFYLITISQPEVSPVSPTPIYMNIQNGSAITVEHDTVSTSGEAIQYVEPDKLTISFTVETEDERASDAQEENAEKVNEVTDTLKAMGISEDDIKTTYYYVNVKRESHYICENKTRETDCYWTYIPVGYEVRHTVSVDVYDIDNGGAVVDNIVDAGAEVDYLSLGLKKETQMELKKELLAEAAGNAKDKAEAIAEGLGVTVTKAMSVSESYSYYPTPYRSYDYAYGAAEEAYDVGTSISTGTIEVSASVSATFEIR